MSLATPVSVQKLQTALHAKAKGSPGFRFYALYDKVYRKDVLAFAYACCQANGGAAGVDGQTFEDIEEYGVRTVAGRTGARAEKSNVSTATGAAGVDPQAGWQAAAVGNTRRSGIVSCKRRRCWCSNRSSRPTCSRNNTPIGQTAAHWTPYKHVHKLINTGHGEMVDADLSGYFD